MCNRCDAKNFILSKSQKKCLKRVNRFLSDGTIPSAVSDRHRSSSPVQESMCESSDLETKNTNVIKKAIEAHCDQSLPTSDDATANAAPSISTPDHVPGTIVKDKQSVRDRSQKAKVKRIERKVCKVMLKRNCSRDEAENLVSEAHKAKVSKKVKKQITLEELFAPQVGAKHRIEVKFVRTSFEPGSGKEAAFNENVVPLEHAVYSRYQKSIHKDDDCTKKQFQRFLCHTPLLFSPFSGRTVDGITGFASYHMQYWLDGEKVLAVGVIDVLPTGISSVYLFYDPDFSSLGLGTYSALRELALVRQLSSQLAADYYYMGFYIHSCPKMRYKARFTPCDLLCPEVRSWHPMQQAVALLDVSKYSRLNPDDQAVDEDAQAIADHSIGMIVADTHTMSNFSRYRAVKSDDADLQSTEQRVRRYASLIGKKAVRSILLYLE